VVWLCNASNVVWWVDGWDWWEKLIATTRDKDWESDKSDSKINEIPRTDKELAYSASTVTNSSLAGRSKAQKKDNEG